MHPQAILVKERNVLLVMPTVTSVELTRLGLHEFFGITIYHSVDDRTQRDLFDGRTVYIFGQPGNEWIANLPGLPTELSNAHQVYLIHEEDDITSKNSIHTLRPLPHDWETIGLGKVPIEIAGGMGVLYRRFFDFNASNDYFQRIHSEHTFQALTESTKPGIAQRTGVYITPVEQKNENDTEELHFRLLRCSTNLAGPTETFRATDREVVKSLNEEAAKIFDGQEQLNHVLAQAYHNYPSVDKDNVNPGSRRRKKSKKAKISAHADKTKDMPSNGIMAFCTFYHNCGKLEPSHRFEKASKNKRTDVDVFDRGWQGMSGLTKLQFCLKKQIDSADRETMKESFSVTLFPNSVFFMPLSTNRLYTHETRPSPLDPEFLPTRMGYVVRCSNRRAVYKQSQTFLKSEATKGEETLVRLEPVNSEGVKQLRMCYAEENLTDASIEYDRHNFNFSMNKGDYMRPHHGMECDFRSYLMAGMGNIFHDLLNSVEAWESTGKGRRGAVLVEPNETRGTPIVRTTTKYFLPANIFGTIHTKVATAIQKLAGLKDSFNNALIENYDNQYRTMGFHSDQELDLKQGSSIAIFSTYQNEGLAATQPRKLVIEAKKTTNDDGPGATDRIEIPMLHNSVIVFSTETNRKFRHKIVLETGGKENLSPNQWLGVTFRTSKTYVQVNDDDDGKPASGFFEDGTPFALANQVEHKEFYTLRRKENQETAFVYPEVTMTISPSDILRPVSEHKITEDSQLLPRPSI